MNDDVGDITTSGQTTSNSRRAVRRRRRLEVRDVSVCFSPFVSGPKSQNEYYGQH